MERAYIGGDNSESRPSNLGLEEQMVIAIILQAFHVLIEKIN